MSKIEKQEMMEINYQDCCLSCSHHTGTRCGRTGRKRPPTRAKCANYKIKPSFDKKVKYDE